jgi:hypothetical protein
VAAQALRKDDALQPRSTESRSTDPGQSGARIEYDLLQRFAACKEALTKKLDSRRDVDFRDSTAGKCLTVPSIF